MKEHLSSMTHTPGRYSVHQKKTVLLPLLPKLAMPDNQFMFPFSSLLRPVFELRTLAGYNTLEMLSSADIH